jgi:hypothetical protein
LAAALKRDPAKIPKGAGADHGDTPIDLGTAVQTCAPIGQCGLGGRGQSVKGLDCPIEVAIIDEGLGPRQKRVWAITLGLVDAPNADNRGQGMNGIAKPARSLIRRARCRSRACRSRWKSLGERGAGWRAGFR